MAHHYDDIRAMEAGRRQPRPGLILGIDPGSEQSGYAVIDRQYRVIAADKVDLACLYGALRQYRPERVAIESLQSYGMPVGRTVFETAYAIGKILRECEVLDLPTVLISRPEYGRALCGGHKVTDSLLRQALLLRFGGDTKGEPLALLRGATDKRSAYAVACYWLDCQQQSARGGDFRHQTGVLGGKSGRSGAKR